MTSMGGATAHSRIVRHYQKGMLPVVRPRSGLVNLAAGTKPAMLRYGTPMQDASGAGRIVALPVLGTCAFGCRPLSAA
jgi:hypothetical protein